MKPNSFFKAVVAIAMMFEFSASADPAQQPSVRLNRSGEISMNAQLSQNMYRTEQYQDNYTERVPYQDTEEYWEDVPYTEREAYTDYEEYYDREWQCHSETDYERECRTVPVCREVREPESCRTVPICREEREPGICRTVRECNPSNPDQCKERTVCEDGGSRNVCHDERRCEGGGTRTECHDETKCENVPRTREKCDWENVRKTRPVTRYRDVTRYRQERRTRTVTRYREETRCCVTREREVFDRQWTQNVQVVFPAAAVLVGNEREVFEVSLAGSENNSDAQFKIINSIYGYSVARKYRQGQTIVIELANVAKYTEAEVGAQTLQSASLEIGPAGSFVKIIDNGMKPKITTGYGINVKDMSGQVVAQASFNAVQAQTRQALNVALNDQQDYMIEVAVQRSGIVLANTVHFVRSFKYDHFLSDMTLFTDPNKVAIVGIEGAFAQTQLVMSDVSPEHPEVNTQYRVRISKNSTFTDKNTIDKVISRSQLQLGADGAYHISLVHDLMVDAAKLDKAMKPGVKGFVEITVSRGSARFTGPVSFKKSAQVKVP